MFHNWYTLFYRAAYKQDNNSLIKEKEKEMKKQSIFNFILAGTLISTFALTSCESNDNRRDSNSEKTEGDVNDPTKYNSGSNSSTRTGGSMGMNNPDASEESVPVSENSGNTQSSGSNTTGDQSSKNSDMNTSKKGTDMGGNSDGTQNITMNSGSGTNKTTTSQNNNKNTRGTSGITGQTGRASGIR